MHSKHIVTENKLNWPSHPTNPPEAALKAVSCSRCIPVVAAKTMGGGTSSSRSAAIPYHNKS
eukprot:860658-Amorphochlora_amoeboformis.AAC.2